MRDKVVIGLSETKDQDVFLTPWTAVHFGVGGVFAQLNVGFWTFQVIHGLYELKDYILTYKTNNDSEYHNSIINSFGDQLFATLGYTLGKHHKNFYWKSTTLATYTLMVIGKDKFG